MFSYIGRYKTITYIGQYKPTSLKSFQYYIYRSIYADKRHISIHICNISWFKLGAYIGPIYIRSYNDRYIKTYILPIYDSEYWSIYENFQKSFFDRYMSKFSFFERYMKILFFFKITISGFYSLVRFMKTSYIGQYNYSYIGRYNNFTKH